MFFWLAVAFACIAHRALELKNQNYGAKAETVLFWAFGLAMVIFVAVRPIGIARDDLGYLEIYSTICPTLICHQWIQGIRDWGWYSLVGLLQSFGIGPRVMLLLAATAVLLKLSVIYSLVRHPLPVLLLYLGLYYEVQDLTAWRASLAITMFMVGIWLIVRFRTYWNSWALILCGVFHKQAFVAPFIVTGKLIKRNRAFFNMLCITPVILLLVGVFPDLQQITTHLGDELHKLFVNQGLDKYFTAKNSGAYTGYRNAPIVVYPQILLILWLLNRFWKVDNRLDSLLVGCLSMACLFLWGCASLPEVQVRFFELFMVPTVLLVGLRWLHVLEFSALVIISGIFVLKYNVLHHLLV